MSRIQFRRNAGRPWNTGSGLGTIPAPFHLGKLQDAGLTARQAEVGFWIAHAKTDEEVAVILRASSRSIAYEVETILETLQLTSRIEIVLHVLETLCWLRWPTIDQRLTQPG